MVWPLSVVTDRAAEPVAAVAVRIRGRALPRAGLAWMAAATLVLAAAITFVAVTSARPGYDAYGWLVWGRQTLHWNLNTDGAPSWKPLTFLFTLPYGLVRGAQQYLWVLTAVTGAFAGAVLAGRIAHRLTGRCPPRAYAPIVAAIVAGAGVLGIAGYAHQLLIANADPLTATLCLAVIDRHLCRAPRSAFGLLVLASLARPEAWAFAALYGAWVWRAVPGARLLVIAGLALIPLIWFGVPALTSKSWLTPGDLDLNSANAIHGDKLSGVVGRFLGLQDWPLELAALVAVIIAAWRRDRLALGLAGAAVGWVGMEIALALHGYSAVSRYLFEPAAVVVVLGAGTVGRVLAWAPERGRGLRWLEIAAVVAFLAALYPYVHHQTELVSRQLVAQEKVARQLDRLGSVIARIGGPRSILDCGQPVTLVQSQSTLAWEVGLNVGNVGFTPGASIRAGIPIVLLKPHRDGWQVRPYNMPPDRAARCDRLRTDSAFG